jgi:hypothetical protein
MPATPPPPSRRRFPQYRTTGASRFFFVFHRIGLIVSAERYTDVVQQLCAVMGIPDVDAVLDERILDVEGFEVLVDHLEADPGALYLNFNYGIVTSGRTLKVFRLLLEANLLIYAQDQAQLGMDADTGCIVMIVRVEFHDRLDGEGLAGLLAHYAEHGRYWRDNIFQTDDEMFEQIADGSYLWMKV